MRRMVAAQCVILVASTLLIRPVSAVGLGQLSAESAINQPLNVRVELLDLGTTALEEITVQLATAEDFARLGVEPNAALPALSLSIARDGEGAHIRVTSSAVVGAAFFDFVLDTRWPAGRILTAHTVLLDPPVFNDAALNDMVAAPQFGSAITATPDQGVITTVLTDRTSTLYSIAMAARPDASVTVQQTMLAIQRLNPKAFGAENINRLYAGEILRLPSRAQIEVLSATQALAIVREQNALNEQRQQSRLGVTTTTPAASDQLSVVVKAAEADAQDSSAGTRAAVPDSAAGVERLAMSQRLEDLGDQLALSQEELARAAREREEFLSRLAAIEGQFNSAQEIIRVQNARIVELEQALEAATVLASESAALGTQRTSAPRTGWVATLAAQPLLVGGGLLAAILLLVGALLRRARTEDEVDADAQATVITLTTATDKSLSEESAGDPIGSGELGALDTQIAARDATDAIDAKSQAENQAAIAAKPAFDPDELAFGAREANTARSGPTESGEEESATKLELAYAYHKMGDDAGAVEILAEVVAEGDEAYGREAAKLLAVIRGELP